MAWFKEFVVKAGEAVNQEYQRRQQQQGQRDSGYGQGQGYQQQGGYGVSPNTSTWQQQQYQAGQYGQPQSPQYGQPSPQYGQSPSPHYQPQSPQYGQPLSGQYGQPQTPQYGQPQSPQYQPQQQYQHFPPPPSPYRPVSTQPEQQAPSPSQNGAQYADPRAQANADLASIQAQADREMAKAKADLEALQAQGEIEMAQARAEMQAAEKEQAELKAQLQSHMDQAQTQTQQLEAQWREAERLAAQYKAEYEAQMKQAEEELAKMRIGEEQQVQELERLRAEEARNHQLGEEEVVREQQRLLDEIQRQRAQQQQQQEPERPPLPPRINTNTEDVAPPLPRRPVSTAGSVSSGSGSQRPTSYYPPPPNQRNSYLSPQGQAPASPSPSYIPPPPPPGPPPQATAMSQGQPGGYLSPTSTGQPPQQTPYYPPPPPSLSQPQNTSPRVQDQSPQQGQRNSFYSSGPAPSPQQQQPNPTTSPPQQQPQASYYSPPTPPAQNPPQQPPPSTSNAQAPRPISPPKPPRVRTPEPAKQHACGAKAGIDCSSALTSFPQHWFYHAAVPEFVICARCYVDYIYDTKFCDSFRKVFYNDGEQRRCRFNTRRVQKTLFPAAVESGSLDELVEFMRKRMTIKDCREQNSVEGELWYVSPDIPNGTICQACFEDGLVVSSFAKNYKLQASQSAYCDVSVWFLKRKFMDLAKENKWTEFCRQFNERVKLPDCPKLNSIKGNDRAWYKPKNGPTSLQACVACYHDYFYASEDENKWEQVRGGNFETRCSLGQLNHVLPMHQALDEEDRNLFWNAAREMAKYPFCNMQGTKGGVWYTPINDPPGWGICAACYEGIVKPIGGSRWFMKDTSITQDGVYLCGFSFGHNRVTKALEAWINARNWGESKLLLDWAAQWGNVQPCPQVEMQKNGRWWGWGVAAICEDCYGSFAKGTALEPRFVLKGDREPNHERMCDLFSRRMRGLYTEACRTGDLQSFLAFAEQRHMIYAQTIPQCQQILNQQKLARMQAQTLGIQGSFYKNLGWTTDATMGHSYTVGNSYVGYGHENEWVAQGYAYDRKAREIAQGVMSGGPLMQIRMLEGRWKEVE
ncbi:hypothetical protein NW762_007881 [Fusarium torreyae]|uniref:Integral membrane protein n=1 Tax=Fusarium torreyae TaxID=1237075 RepID=A0A9W8VD93_9HYPO|nr:hypothetical protein NW762_007881 [Fusarium torreyae]